MRKLIRVDKEKAVISLGRFQPIKTVSYMDGGGGGSVQAPLSSAH